jgi:L-ascorbate metabolism protein UlaG (beta-lactamase superfamily)
MRRILPPPRVPDPRRWPDRGLFAAWLGHSTVFLKIDGFTMITDPVFSSRAGIRVGPVTLGIKRLVAPAVPLIHLPKVDLILLSHAHMDHWDIRSLRRLESRHTAVVNPHRTSDLLRAARYKRVQELSWNQTARIGPASVRALEVRHWGARIHTDTWRGYNGYLVEIGRYRVLFAGDTALTTGFRAIRATRAVDLAIMPIGAYNPWVRFHCTPEQAWQMGNDAGAGFVLPIHHQTFALGREPLLEPIHRLYDAAGSRSERIALRRIGQEFELP